MEHFLNRLMYARLKLSIIRSYNGNIKPQKVYDFSIEEKQNMVLNFFYLRIIIVDINDAKSVSNSLRIFAIISITS